MWSIVVALLGSIRSALRGRGELVLENLADPMQRPGVALRAARLRSEMTQADLAAKIGCEQGDISKMESGRFPIGKGRAKKFGAVLSINYRVFL